MSGLDLTDEHKAAWRGNIGTYLADALVIALAGRRKAEFALIHVVKNNHEGLYYCMECGVSPKFPYWDDPRHNYTDDAWLWEAREELGQ